jgi:hypothetical protein
MAKFMFVAADNLKRVTMKIGLIIFTVASVLSILSVHATEITILGHSEDSQQVMPKRGTSIEAVLDEFGEPEQRFKPIGEPPIMEWSYGSFRVYFEHHIVLHSIDLNTLILPNE